MVTHLRILARRIPWTEEPGRLQPLDHKVGQDGVTNSFTFIYNTLQQCFLLIASILGPVAHLSQKKILQLPKLICKATDGLPTRIEFLHR